jgi:hypothetical protein|tara:strand:+ start:2231 stop:2410 length:180 start_codon:yes stop_codon:yes gene_type:complete
MTHFTNHESIESEIDTFKEKFFKKTYKAVSRNGVIISIDTEDKMIIDWIKKNRADLMSN